MKNYKLIIGLLFLSSLLQVSCTRLLDQKSELSFKIPLTSNQKVGAMSTLQPEVLIFNLRVGPTGFPMVREINEDELGSAVGSSLDVVLDDASLGQPIPKVANLYVQYLGVFKNSSGVMQFSYGDATVDTSGGGNIDVSILANFFGSSSKMGRVGGRFFDTDGNNPSGALVMQFNPPNNKPKMNAKATAMFDGWFNDLIVLDDSSVSISYTLLTGTGAVDVFPNLTLSSPMFDVSSNPPHLVKMTTPASYRRDYGSGLEPVGEEELYLGFFQVAAPNAPVSFSSYKSCYLGTHEALTDMFSDSAGTTPLQYQASGGSAATQVVVENGGVSISNPYDFLYNASLCGNLSDATRLRFFHQRLREHETVFGFEGPFQVIKPTGQFSELLEAKYNSTNNVNLKWKYLPGVSGSSVDGVDIFVYKRPTNDSGDSGGKDNRGPCNQELSMQGYQLLATGVTGETYNLVSSTPFGNVDNSNYHQFQFAACPYNNKVDGGKEYWGHYAESHCMGSCGGSMHFGRGISSPSLNSNTFTDASVGGAFAKVNDISDSGDYLTIDLGAAVSGTNLSSPGSADGKEVSFIVMAEGNPDGCGSHLGENIQPGRFSSTQVLQHTYSGNFYLKVPKGTFLDSMTTTPINSALINGSYNPTQDFCWLQAVIIPHYDQVTIGASGLTANPFSFTNGGGIVAYRANKTILSGPVSAFAKGFPGGISTGEHGAGVRGINNSTNHTFSGGYAGSNSGGGSGIGQGGQVSGSAAGGNDLYSFLSGGEIPLIMGSGSGRAGIISGLRGSGIIFIASNIIDVTTNTNTHFDAAGKTDPGAGPYAGGSGGGTVIVRSNSVTSANSYSLSLLTSGGDGAYPGSGAYSGAGGGGLAKAFICGDNSLVNGDTSAGDGGSAVTTPAGSGNTDIFESDTWFCN